MKLATLAMLAAAMLAAREPAWAQPWRPGARSTTPPSKEAIDEARERYQRGIHLYEEGSISGALAEMQRSYEIAPSYRVLLNLGKVARSLPDYATALTAYERYLVDGADDVPPEKRAEVQREIEQLQSLVAKVSIVTDTAGAAILLDEAPLGNAPLPAAILLNPGRYRVTAEKEGAATSKVISVAGRDELTVELKLPAPQRAEPAPPALEAGAQQAAKPAAIRGERADGERSFLWVGWAATGALAAGATVTGILALNASSDLSGTAYSGPSPSSDIEALKRRVDGLAIATDVIVVAATLSLGATLVAVFTRRSAPSRTSLRLGPSGASLTGSF